MNWNLFRLVIWWFFSPYCIILIPILWVPPENILYLFIVCLNWKVFLVVNLFCFVGHVDVFNGEVNFSTSLTFWAWELQLACYQMPVANFFTRICFPNSYRFCYQESNLSFSYFVNDYYTMICYLCWL